MHNPRIRPPGGWAALTVLTPVEAEAIDEYCAASINGDAGGTWAPVAVITIGGIGIAITTTLAGNWTATGNPQFNGSPTFNAIPTFAAGGAVTAGTFSFAAGVNVTLAAGAQILAPLANASFNDLTLNDSSSLSLSAMEEFNTYVFASSLLYLGSGFSAYYTIPGSILESNTAGSCFAEIEIPRLPTGAVITGIYVYLDGDGGGSAHALLPALPQASLMRSTLGAAAIVTVASATDPSAALVDYEARHEIHITGMIEPVAATHRYFVHIAGESGANAVNNSLLIYGLRVKWFHNRLCQLT